MSCVREVGLHHVLDLLLEKGDRVVGRQDLRKVLGHAGTTGSSRERLQKLADLVKAYNQIHIAIDIDIDNIHQYYTFRTFGVH